MNKPNKVAVYGSLRKGLGNWQWALSNPENAELKSTEKVKGFKMVSLGGFPGIYTSNDESEIVIEVYDVTESTFKRLDQLEGYPSFYDRKQIETSDGEAWVYFIDSLANGEKELVPDGDWVAYRANNRRQ